MSTGTTESHRSPSRTTRTVLRSLLLLTLVLPALAACSDDDPPPGASDPYAAAGSAITQTLRQRARALTARDQVLFGRTITDRDPGFSAEQETYYDNLAQLPVSDLRYRVVPDSLVPDGDRYWAEVEIHLRLQGYDAAAVVTRDRFRFTPVRGGSRLLLSSTTDREWEAEFQPQAQPWDVGEIEVREAAGVLGVFDVGTLARSDAVLDSVAHGRFDVIDVVPAEETPRVIVYSLADSAFLDAVDGLPVDPDRLDAVTIPVPRDAADPDGPVASYRILLNARVLAEQGPALDRLVRHELTHVALGDRGRGAPLWLTEGVAEYVSVRPMAPSDRRLPSDALNLVAAGVTDLPPDDVFGGADAEGWYALSWWVCEYVAATYGEATLWSLLDALEDGADQDLVLSELLGLTPSELAAEGGALMQRTYG